MSSAVSKTIIGTPLDESRGGIDHFLDSWAQKEVHAEPYPHYLLENVLPASLVDGALELPLEGYDLDYNLGTREEYNSFRSYLTPDLIAEHSCVDDIVSIFRSPEVIQTLEQFHHISLKDSLLRIEYAIDKDRFWLKPHTDLGVKLFTMLIYLSKDDDAESWGTDVYENEHTHCKKVPFKSNSAVYFIPSNNTWHGFNPHVIKGIRKTLIVNYVTQEWRNRQELTHPTQPVY